MSEQSSNSNGNDDPHEQSHTKLFVGVFFVLGLLTALSFGVANSSIMDHPPTGWTVMMLISVAKASLVILFFMHLRWETNWKYLLTFPAAVMSLVLVLMLVPDIADRVRKYSDARSQRAPEQIEGSGSESEQGKENSSH